MDGLLKVPGIALARDHAALAPRFPIYNSGVIVFQKNDPLIFEWAKQSIEKNELFRGDQDLLSQIIAEKGIRFVNYLPSTIGALEKEREKT